MKEVYFYTLNSKKIKLFFFLNKKVIMTPNETII